MTRYAKKPSNYASYARYATKTTMPEGCQMQA
jgi:hypothetical protein